MDDHSGGQRQLTTLGRIVAVAGFGSMLASGMSWDLDRTNAASLHDCAVNQDEYCGFGTDIINLAVGFVVAVTAIWLCFAILGLRPKVISVPSGIAVSYFTTAGYLQAVPGGRLHPTWAFVLVMTLTFTFLGVAIVVTPPRLRIAVIIVLVVLLLLEPVVHGIGTHHARL